MGPVRRGRSRGSPTPNRNILHTISRRCARMLGLSNASSDSNVKTGTAVVVPDDDPPKSRPTTPVSEGAVHLDKKANLDTIDENGEVFVDAQDDSSDTTLINVDVEPIPEIESNVPRVAAPPILDEPVAMYKETIDEHGRLDLIKVGSTVLFTVEQKALWDHHTNLVENYFAEKLENIVETQTQAQSLSQYCKDKWDETTRELNLHREMLEAERYEVFKLKGEVECLNLVITHLKKENEKLKQGSSSIGTAVSPRENLLDQSFRNRSVRRASLTLRNVMKPKPKRRYVRKVKGADGKRRSQEFAATCIGVMSVGKKANAPTSRAKKVKLDIAAAIEQQDLRRSKRTMAAGSRWDGLYGEGTNKASSSSAAANCTITLDSDSDDSEVEIKNSSFRMQSMRTSKRTSRGNWKF